MSEPIILIKIKSPNGEQPITPTDLEKWRDYFMEAQNDPDFKVFTHDAVTIETINSDYSHLMKDTDFFDKVIKEKENVKLNLSIREYVHLIELECENFDKDSPIKIAAIAMIVCENLSKETSVSESVSEARKTRKINLVIEEPNDPPKKMSNELLKVF